MRLVDILPAVKFPVTTKPAIVLYSLTLFVYALLIHLVNFWLIGAPVGSVVFARRTSTAKRLPYLFFQMQPLQPFLGLVQFLKMNY